MVKSDWMPLICQCYLSAMHIHPTYILDEPVLPPDMDISLSQRCLISLLELMRLCSPYSPPCNEPNSIPHAQALAQLVHFYSSADTHW